MKRLTDIQEIQNYYEIVEMHPRNVSKKIQKHISSKTGDIPLFDFGEEVSKQKTDRHTRNSELFGNGVTTSQECLQKIS